MKILCPKYRTECENNCVWLPLNPIYNYCPVYRKLEYKKSMESMGYEV